MTFPVADVPAMDEMARPAGADPAGVSSGGGVHFWHGEGTGVTSASKSAAAARVRLAPVWIFWLLLAVLTFLNALINTAVNMPLGLPRVAPLIPALADCALWALLTPVIFRFAHLVITEARLGLLLSMACLLAGVVLSLGISAIGAYTRYWVIDWLASADLARFFVTRTLPSESWLRYGFISDFYSYLVVVAAGFAYSYMGRYRSQLERAARLNAQLASAQVDAIRSQLNPHFLFNTLNMITAMTELDPAAARDTLAQLSALLRDTLKPGEPEIPLAQELAVVRRYVQLVRRRFRDRLEVVERIQDEALDGLVPNFILQPIIENAVKYGVESRPGQGRIILAATRSGARLVMTVEDDGSGVVTGEHVAAAGGFGLGLMGVRRRLYHEFGDEQSLRVTARENGGTRVEIILPFRTRAGVAGSRVRSCAS